jgi:hypothetical protein
MRIINSPTTLSAYSARADQSSGLEREAIKKVLTLVRLKGPKFHASCDSLMAKL